MWLAAWDGRNDRAAGICFNGLDPERNNANKPESDLADNESRTRVFAIPANEELVIARETVRHLGALVSTA